MRYPIIILTILVLTIGTAFGQDYKLEDFVETNLPKVGSDAWYELNHSRNGFKVSIENGVVKVDKADDERDALLEIDMGRLIGSDHGEWGGKIEFIPKGTSDKKLIKEGNVKFIFRTQRRIYKGGYSK